MRKLLFLIIVVFLAGCKADGVSPAGYFDASGKTTYQDRDWNIEFYDNCGFPGINSAQWITEGKETFLRFTLKNNEVGRCSPDGTRDPYRERAEIKQTTILYEDTDYSLTYRIRFVKGFHYTSETFMQIHQNAPGCGAKPLIKLEFSGGYFRWHWDTQIKDILGKWLDVKVDFNTSKSYNMYVNGEKIVSSGYFFKRYACGDPYLKFGIYRLGDPNATDERVSIVDIDKINLVEVKK